MGEILLTSSSEIFGDISSGSLNERSDHNPKSGYAVSKLAAEYGLKGFSKEYGQNYRIVRYFNVYGPGQVAEFVIPRFIRMAQQGTPPTVYGDGSQTRSFCHISDAARATTDLFLHPDTRGAEFNIGNDLEPVTVKDLATRVCRLVNPSVSPLMVDFAHSDRSRSREIFHRIPDISKVRDAIGFEPRVNLEDGIRSIVQSGPIPVSWEDELAQG